MTAQTFIKVDKATFYRFMAQEPEGRYEYVRGRIMQQQAGGSLRHSRIGARFHLHLSRFLDDSRYVILEQRGVDTPETIRYPDVVVEAVGAPDDSRATTEPILIVEALSPTSEDRDLFVKPAEYLALPSLAAYIVASQDEPACVVWVRDQNGQFPRDGIDVKGLSQSIEIPSLGVTIALDDIYRGLFNTAAPADKPT